MTLLYTSPYRRVGDERLSIHLPRGRGKLIGGDLYVDDESSGQNVELLRSLHHKSVGYRSVRT
jgi:hypothetical protein